MPICLCIRLTERRNTSLTCRSAAFLISFLFTVCALWCCSLQGNLGAMDQQMGSMNLETCEGFWSGGVLGLLSIGDNQFFLLTSRNFP